MVDSQTIVHLLVSSLEQSMPVTFTVLCIHEDIKCAHPCLLNHSDYCFPYRINIEARKSPKMSRAAQEISRSPRLPIRKPSIGSPSLTRREFPLEDITQVLSSNDVVMLASKYVFSFQRQPSMINLQRLL